LVLIDKEHVYWSRGTQWKIRSIFVFSPHTDVAETGSTLYVCAKSEHGI